MPFPFGAAVQVQVQGRRSAGLGSPPSTEGLEEQLMVSIADAYFMRVA
jgi:hypothetical protein